ncbi:MAG: 7-cyano-7-deazaguanine synthase [Nanoarchaeota archaeon]|nr:7-cyano-7-deazaguanine synthase [Nanoarchaeota archaeon]
MGKNAIILCSGGLDSVVTAHYVKNKLKYNSITILFFNYGQKALTEERKASKLCAKKIHAIFIEISLPELGNLSTSLINLPGKIVQIAKKDLKDTKQESKKWYVPCRNLIFLSYASALTDSEFIKNNIKSDIFIGFKCEGNDSYPDTTKEFIKKINSCLSTSCSFSIKIKAPLIEKDKEDIIILGNNLNVDLEKTFSCYSPKNAKHCGICLSCALRKEAFYWANMEDKTLYSN